jgi:uncharacterized protein (TIGR03086 family)
MEVVEAHARSVEFWLDRLQAVSPERMTDPTPCAEWDVRELVNHLVGEDRWTAPLVQGSTIEEVGDRFDGDLLGSDAHKAAKDAAQEAVAAFRAPGAIDRIVHLSFGDTPAEEYAWQLTADHLIHAWDLAAAAGGDRTLDDALVAAVADWFAGREALYRAAGAIGPRPEVSAETRQDRLIASFGRDPNWTPSA